MLLADFIYIAAYFRCLFFSARFENEKRRSSFQEEKRPKFALSVEGEGYLDDFMASTMMIYSNNLLVPADNCVV